MPDFRDVINSLAQRIHRVELKERAEQAGAVKPLAFIDLPAAGKRGSLLYCTDCLKVGETTGNGTGTIIYSDSSAWRRVGDDTTAAD